MTKIDPRYYQLLIQASLLLFGILSLNTQISISDIAIVFISALATQYLFTRFYHLPFNPLSTVNTSMSLLLLLQVSETIWFLIAVLISIASKFLLRWNNRHIFNPSNIGIVIVLLIGGAAWVDPGKWGQEMWWALAVAGAGLILLLGISRMSTTLSFLAVFGLLLVGRAAWLGDPLTIPLHQLQSGALWIFAFFMLSDPMTTPNAQIGRVIFGAAVAIIAWILQFVYYVPNAFLYALALMSPIVVVLNTFFRDNPFQWTKQIFRYHKRSKNHRENKAHVNKTN